MAIDPLEQHRISDSSLSIPAFGFGCGFLGDPAQAISEEQAQDTLLEAWTAGVRYFDTAPWYGNTLSEHRTGHFLRQRPREDFCISTKVGRVYFAPEDTQAHLDSKWMQRWKGGLPFDLRFDYSASGITRSYEDSLARLGLNRVDALVIHDLDPRHQEGEERVAAGLDQLDSGGGFAALEQLRSRGHIKAIGAGVNHLGMIPRFLERFDLDYFLVAMPYTLLDQEALDGEFELCARHNVSVVIGAVFASGILATGATPDATYRYAPASDEIMQKVARIESICRKHEITLPAAALQFPLGHPVVKSIIPGANAPWQVRNNFEALSSSIPQEFWTELKSEGLLRPDAPTETL